MGAEDDHPLGERHGPLGPAGVVGIWLAAGPAGDGVLQLVEHPYVNVVGGAPVGDEIVHAAVGVVAVGEFQYGLVHLLAKPYNTPAYHAVSLPLTVTHQPGGLNPGEFRRCTAVQHEGAVTVHLQV